MAVDDIHLADAASIDALAGLAATGTYGNIAVVGTERAGEPVSQSLAHMLAAARFLELDRMTQPQISELCSAALGPAAPSATLVEDLERVSSGNVYFVLEILRNLASRGLIERKRTRVSLPDALDAVQLPVNLSEAVERRLASLSPTALALMRVTAVVGRAIRLDFGRPLVNATDIEYLDAVDELQREELIQFHNRNLNIYHPRLREIVYQGLSQDERRELHQRVADQILLHQGREDRDRTAELGHHFAEAGDKSRALEYLVKAGDVRYEGFAYFDAREAYQRAYDLLHVAPFWQHHELERKLNDRLGRICFYYDHRRGPEYLERARLHHLRHGLLWAIAPLSRLLGATLSVALAVSVTALLNALRLRRQPLQVTLERLLDSFATTTYLSNCYNYSGRAQLALTAAEQLLPFVYSRHRMPRVGYLMARVYALFLMNQFDESAAACDEVLSIVNLDKVSPVSEHDRIHATGGALVTRLWIDMARGYSKRSRWWQSFERFVLDHPTTLFESWLMEARVFAAYRQGNLVETETAWKQFGERAVQAEVMFVQNKTKVWAGMAYLDFGRISEAQDIADEVIRDAKSPENPFILALGLLLRGMALHAWEQMEDAEHCLREAAQLTQQTDVSSWELHHSVLLSLSLLTLDMGNSAHARELASTVEGHNAPLTLSHDLHTCRANRILGRIALVEGAIAEALNRLEKAATLASDMDDSLEQAWSLHFFAQALLAQGDEQQARRCRNECEKLLVKLDNRYQLRRLGYAATAQADSSADAPVVSTVFSSATDPNMTSTIRDEMRTRTSGSCPESSLPRSVLELPEGALREKTLVASGCPEPHE